MIKSSINQYLTHIPWHTIRHTMLWAATYIKDHMLSMLVMSALLSPLLIISTLTTTTLLHWQQLETTLAQQQTLYVYIAPNTPIDKLTALKHQLIQDHHLMLDNVISPSQNLQQLVAQYHLPTTISTLPADTLLPTIMQVHLPHTPSPSVFLALATTITQLTYVDTIYYDKTLFNLYNYFTQSHTACMVIAALSLYLYLGLMQTMLSALCTTYIPLAHWYHLHGISLRPLMAGMFCVGCYLLCMICIWTQCTTYLFGQLGHEITHNYPNVSAIITVFGQHMVIKTFTFSFILLLYNIIYVRLRIQASLITSENII